MAGECIPLYEPGKAITVHANDALTGKRFCRVQAAKQAGSTLTPTGADTVTGGNIVVDQTFPNPPVVPALGVIDRSCADEAKTGCLRGGVVPMEAGAAVVAGVRVMPDTTGRCITLAVGAGPDIPKAHGIALTAATTAGDEVMVALMLG